MFRRIVTDEEAIYLLDMRSKDELDAAVAAGQLKVAEHGPHGREFVVADIVLCKLAHVIAGLGVERGKSSKYAEAVLGSRLSEHETDGLDWVENDPQELFCMIADNELARIFLRNKDDSREVEVGAVKPVLLPTTRCEINVFRVIRPVLYKARRLTKSP
jgi:hypothetical protein